MFDDKTFEQMRIETGGETEIGALYREYIQLGDEAEKAEEKESSAAGQVLFRQCDEIADKIINLPAVSIHDVFVHVELLGSYLPPATVDEDSAIAVKLYGSIYDALNSLVGTGSPAPAFATATPAHEREAQS